MSQINVNTITGKDGGSAVNFPHGIIVTGVVTATSLNQNTSGNITAASFTGPLTGNVTGTADLASNLTGTPNITVGTVTGTDATFSGNLTVNGTTTTIDTAVTAVDSLAVDGSVGVGTTNPQQRLHLSSTASTYIQVQNTGDSVNAYYGVDTASAWAGSSTNHPFKLHTNNVERLRIDQHGTSKFKGPLTEKCNRDTGAGLTGDYNHDLITHGNVHWATSNSSGTWTYNLRGSATVALNDMMADGETLSFQLISAQNSTSNYMTAFKIDGSSSHLVWWQGGSAPSEGGGSGYDVYTFTVFKIGNASFRTFAALSNHA